MSVTLHAERLGALTSLGSPIALPATYTINIWVKNVNLDGTQQWSNLYQETNGYKYVLDAHYGRIGAGNWTNNTTPDPARLSLAAGDPLKVANTWHLVTAVYGGTSIEYFANGVSIGTVDPTANATLATSFNVLNSPAGQAFAAEVKDLRVYSGVATAAEILVSFNNGDGDLLPLTLTDGLVAKYKFDTDGTDSVASNNGTVSGATFGNNYVTFDGGNDYISIPHNANNPFNTDYSSVSMWINTTTTSESRLLFKGYAPSSDSLWDHRIMSNGKAYFYWRDETGSLVHTMTSSTSVNDGSWHHLMVVRDGSVIKMYVDGSVESTVTGVIGAWSSTYDMYIGKWDHPSYPASSFFDGSLDDVRIWSRALTATEAAELNTAGAEVPAALTLTDGLVAGWNFAVGTGEDSVGSADGAVTDLTYGSAGGITYAEADGSGNKMDLGTPASLDFGTSDFTISGWANMDVIPTGASGAALYNKGMTSLSSPKFNGAQISFFQGNVRFFVGGQGSYTAITQPMSTGQWYHFAGTRSGTTMKLYINGVLADTQDTGTIKDVTSSLNGTIFSNYNGTWYTNVFDGKLADIRIWSRSLSLAEAASVHTTGPEVPTPDDLIEGLNKFVCSVAAPVGDVGFTKGDEEAVFVSSGSGYYLWLRENGIWGQYQSAAIATALSFEWMAAADRMYFQGSVADQLVFASKRQDATGYCADGANRDGLVERFVHGSTVLDIVEASAVVSGTDDINFGVCGKFVQVLEQCTGAASAVVDAVDSEASFQYTFDDQTASDSVGSSNGTVSGGVTFSDVSNRSCATFDGVDGYIYVPFTNTTASVQGSTSFSLWVLFGDTPASDETIVEIAKPTWPNSHFRLTHKSSGDLELSVNQGQSGSATVTASAPSGWALVTMTKAGATIKLYLNDTLAGTGSGVNGTFFFSPGGWNIGRAANGSSYSSHSIDNFRVWTAKTLSAAEVAQDYAEGAVPSGGGEDVCDYKLSTEYASACTGGIVVITPPAGADGKTILVRIFS